MKRIISVVLVLSLLLAQVPFASATEAVEQCEIRMVSNLAGATVPTQCRNVDGIAYITAEYAAIAGDCAYQVTDEGLNFYGRGFDFVTDNYYLDEQGEYWVPIAGTLEKMEVQTTAAPGVLTAQGKYYSVDDLQSAMAQAFDGKWRISAMDGFAGNVGITSATVYNIITEWKWADGFTGKYAQDQYKEAFALLMTEDEAESEDSVLAAIQDVDGSLSLMSKLEKASVGAENIDDVLDSFTSAELTGGETMLALYDDVTNPVKAIFDKLDKSDTGYSDAFAFLDIGTQLEIVQYIMSIMNASTYYVDMVDVALLSDFVFDTESGHWGDHRVYRAAEELVDYFQSDTYRDILEEVIEKELEALFYSGINEALETATKSGAALTAAFGAIYDGVTEFLTGTAHSETINDEEMTYYLANIQTAAKKMYRVYSVKPGMKKEAKYAALLYLRCAMVWSYLFDGQVSGADFEGYRERLTKVMTGIMEIPDFDIVGVVKNDEIAYEDIKVPELLPADLAFMDGGSLSVILDLDGIPYMRGIRFSNEGTVTLYAGPPYSEMYECYEGTYTLQEEEEPYTFYLELQGGSVYINDEGFYEFEKQDYELIMRLTPVAGTDQVGVSILWGNKPIFYAQDFPNFTYTPDA